MDKMMADELAIEMVALKACESAVGSVAKMAVPPAAHWAATSAGQKARMKVGGWVGLWAARKAEKKAASTVA